MGSFSTDSIFTRVTFYSLLPPYFKKKELIVLPGYQNLNIKIHIRKKHLLLECLQFYLNIGLNS